MSEKYPQQAPPAQRQHTQPGEESAMDPQPVYDDPDYRAGANLRVKPPLLPAATAVSAVL